ncbi:MAG: helicase-related protein [Vicinamibacterales bacterium]
MRPGDLVIVRDESWTVARADAFGRCTVLTLEGRGPGNAGRRFHAVTPFDQVGALPANRARLRKRRAVLRQALAALADQRPAGGLWTAAPANLDLLAYQLEPALAVLRGATRVLLADAVGLGKTVQAALILAELRDRGLVDRALILCPAGVREVWVNELRERFRIAAAVFDHSSIALGLAELPPGVNPWSSHPVIVASIDFVKRPEVLAAVEEVAFDLVIADEAHHLTPGSDRGHAVNRLGRRSPWLVLMSATPHSGDHHAFTYLTEIGALGDGLTVFRRTRRDLGSPAGRHTHLIHVVPTADEATLLRATDAYARAIWHARGQSDRAVQLVAITLARRAASSAAALAETLARRRALLAPGAPPIVAQAVLPWDDVDDEDGDELDERLARPGLPDAAAERRQLDALIDLAQRAASRSSKFLRLLRMLRRAAEPVVVFTEYRDTLSAAATVLAASFRLGVIHGGVQAPMRQEVLRQFDSGRLDVLLATDTAGEGLSLHRRCRMVVDLELPWNPLRLEQRAGRVDRIGQQRRVHATHLLHRGSVEERVWRHVELRRARAGQALGSDDPPTEDEVAKAIFDEVALPQLRAATLTSARVDAAGELARVIGLRRWRPHAGTTFDQALVTWPRRPGGRDWTAVVLHEISTFRTTGGLCERRAHAVLANVGGAASRGAWRDLAAALQSAGLGGVEKVTSEASWQSALARTAAARRELAAQPMLHQASLFDRRAEREARCRRDAIARLDAALARREQSFAIEAARPIRSRLIALWPLVSTP